jgi:iron complex transport system substrate-binding protein
MKRLLIVFLWLFTASGLAQSKYPVTVTHDSGQTTLTKRPERIIAMGPYMLDILLSLGVQPVGYATVGAGVDNWGLGANVLEVPGLPTLNTQPVNVGLRQSPSLEVMLSLKPDLILAELPTPERFKLFSGIAPTLLYTGNLPDDWRRSIVSIARALGRETQAVRVLAQDKERINAARARIEPKLRGQKVALFVTPGAGGAFTGTLQLRTGLDWTSNILQRLGIQLVRPKGVALDALGLATLQIEAVSQFDVDFIFVLVQRSRNLEQTRNEWFSNRVLASLPASKAKQVFFVDQYLWSVIRGPTASTYVIEDVVKAIGGQGVK